MNNNRKNFIVGLFLLIGMFATSGVFIWFNADQNKQFDHYVAIFHEPVDGLSASSKVKYNGVEVGGIEKVELDPKNPSNVHVSISIEHGTPITVTTVAELKSQGITGMAFIGLSNSNNASSLVVPNREAPYTEIPTKLSFLSGIKGDAEGLTTNLNEISEQLKKLLADDNLVAMHHSLQNVDQITTVLLENSKLMSVTIAKVNENSDNLNKTMLSVNQLANSLKTTNDSLNQLIVDFHENTLNPVNSELLPNMNRAIKNVDKTSQEINQLLTTINNNPTILIRGEKPIKSGPGEK